MLHLKTTKLVEVGRISSSDLHSLLPSPSAAEITCVLHWGISVPGTLTMSWGYKLGTLKKGERNFPSLQPHDKNFVIFSCPLGCSHSIALHLWSWQSVSGSVATQWNNWRITLAENAQFSAFFFLPGLFSARSSFLVCFTFALASARMKKCCSGEGMSRWEEQKGSF